MYNSFKGKCCVLKVLLFAIKLENFFEILNSLFLFGKLFFQFQFSGGCWSGFDPSKLVLESLNHVIQDLFFAIICCFFGHFLIFLDVGFEFYLQISFSLLLGFILFLFSQVNSLFLRDKIINKLQKFIVIKLQSVDILNFLLQIHEIINPINNLFICVWLYEIFRLVLLRPVERNIINIEGYPHYQWDFICKNSRVWHFFLAVIHKVILHGVIIVFQKCFY